MLRLLVVVGLVVGHRQQEHLRSRLALAEVAEGMRESGSLLGSLVLQ
jgi:hypothetical protein